MCRKLAANFFVYLLPDREGHPGRPLRRTQAPAQAPAGGASPGVDFMNIYSCNIRQQQNNLIGERES